MAYDAIVHGARGILYWGAERIDDPAFRTSLYAVTAELGALSSSLAGAEVDEVRVRAIPEVEDRVGRGVRAMLRRQGNEFVLILVNEDATPQMGVEVEGLSALEGRTLTLLYGEERISVGRGRLVTRLPGYEVKVFATDPRWVASPRAGRDYGVVASAP